MLQKKCSSQTAMLHNKITERLHVAAMQVSDGQPESFFFGTPF